MLETQGHRLENLSASISIQIGDINPRLISRGSNLAEAEILERLKAIIMLRLEDLSAKMSIKIASGDITGSPRLISRRSNLAEAG